jgi:uncharacterized membrane protein
VQRKHQPDRYLIAVYFGALVYGLCFSWFSLRRYDAFGFSDFDLAIYVHEAWKILHGSADISLLNHTPIWGNNLGLLSFVLAPLYALSGYDPKIFLILQSFVLGFGAVPVFLIAHRHLSEKFALSTAFSYLFYPALWYSNLHEYYPVVFATFTLLMMFHYFESDRFRPFIIFLLATLLIRLDLTVVVVMFAVYAWLQKKSWRWIAVPFITSGGWLLLGLFVIIPHFKGAMHNETYYAQFGGSFAQAAAGMLTHPKTVLECLLTTQNLKLLWQLLAPAMFFPLLAFKEFVIGGLSLLQHLLSGRSSEHEIYYHYMSTITPFVYISMIYGMKRLREDFEPVGKWICILPVIVSIVCNIWYGPLSKPQAYIALVKPNPVDAYKNALLKEIPPDAPAISSFEFSARLSGRFYYYSFHYVYSGLFLFDTPYVTPDNIQYALVNFHDTRMLTFFHRNVDLNMRKFLADGNFGVVDKAGTTVLFKRNYREGGKLYEIEASQPLEGGLVQVNDNVRLSKADWAKAERRGNRFLDFTFHWTSLKKTDDMKGLYIALRDREGKNVLEEYRIICYGVYPTYRWLPGEQIKDYYSLLLPNGLKSGSYRIYLGFYSFESGKPCPLNVIESNGRLSPSQNLYLLTTVDLP